MIITRTITMTTIIIIINNIFFIVEDGEVRFQFYVCMFLKILHIKTHLLTSKTVLLALLFRWRFNDADITGNNYRVYSNGTLYIIDVTLQTEGSYMCVVTDSETTVYSNNVQLRLACKLCQRIGKIDFFVLIFLLEFDFSLNYVRL